MSHADGKKWGGIFRWIRRDRAQKDGSGKISGGKLAKRMLQMGGGRTG